VNGFSRAATARNFTGPALRALYRLEVEGAALVPTTGALILQIDGDGLLAGPVLKAVTPRPVHTVVSGALAQVLMGHSPGWAGDLALEGHGFAAYAAASALLHGGEAVAILGDSSLLGLLLASSGAAVQPVTISGAGGKVATDPPRPRSRIGIVFEAPITISPSGDPCALATVQQLSELVRQARADARSG
jgi:hypothetical protein